MISQLVIFGLFLLFFLIINPIIPYDADDWTYLSRFRIPLPLISEWNPTKVLPETLMPFGGWSAEHIFYKIFYKILNNYVLSVTVAGGILLALFVSLFGLGAYIFSKDRLKFSAFHALYFEIVMLIQADQEQKEFIEFVVPDYRNTDLSWRMGDNMSI